MASALAGFHRRIPVGHVEAGLRTGDTYSPYPEEMNRRIITRLATYHFAATPHNRETLLSEGVAHESIFVTGNPVIDSLKTILERSATKPVLEEVLKATQELKRIVVTTHRRESFGEVMAENLRVLRRFVERYEDLGLIFPVHPNPAVLGPATSILAGHPRIHLIQPLSYEHFIVLLSHAWLIVSDSGGIQEEAPSLGKPLLVLRENTERPEAIAAGVARLVGGSPQRLAFMLEELHQDGRWAEEIRHVKNPFGQGDSGKRIVQIITDLFGGEVGHEPCEVSR
jgi:UDP-N-acetylglucosamine 2-epimerase (non-hydrolysing)